MKGANTSYTATATDQYHPKLQQQDFFVFCFLCLLQSDTLLTELHSTWNLIYIHFGFM